MILRKLTYALLAAAFGFALGYVVTGLELLRLMAMAAILAEMYLCTASMSIDMARTCHRAGLALAAGLGVVAGVVVGTALLTICLGIVSPVIPWAMGLTFLTAGTVPGLLAARRQRS